MTVCTTALLTFLMIFAAQGRAAPAVDGMSALELRSLALQATLRIEARSCQGSIRGSGFVVGESLITNRHLVEEAAEAKVDGPIATSLRPVTWMSPRLDLAVVQAPPAIGLRWSMAVAEPGQSVLMAGHAGGATTQFVEGVVSVRVSGANYGASGEVLLIDGETSEGFSGGPVLDESGDVVAVLSGFDPVTGLTVAIPADLIQAEIDGASGSTEIGDLTLADPVPTVCG